MRRLSGLLLTGAIMLLPAFSQGHGGVRAQGQALTFDGDTAIVTVAIKPDKTADFEEVMAKLKEGLMKSTKPERKEQAAGWRVFKSPEMAGMNHLYVFVIYPAVKGADYQISNIIAEAFPTEANAILQKYADAYAQGMNIVNLNLLQDLGK